MDEYVLYAKLSPLIHADLNHTADVKEQINKCMDEFPNYQLILFIHDYPSEIKHTFSTRKEYENNTLFKYFPQWFDQARKEYKNIVAIHWDYQSQHAYFHLASGKKSSDVLYGNNMNELGPMKKEGFIELLAMRLGVKLI